VVAAFTHGDAGSSAKPQVAHQWIITSSQRPWFTRQSTMEVAMDWNRVEGNWKQVKGQVKEKWGKLTDDDLTAINGRRDQLEGKIQERYGLAKDQAKKQIDDWYGSQSW
jgi:uncharacterized protein YjbJ (UPF0337 family)